MPLRNTLPVCHTPQDDGTTCGGTAYVYGRDGTPICGLCWLDTERRTGFSTLVSAAAGLHNQETTR